MDEIDAVGGRRSAKDQQYSKMTLNQLLVDLDGFTPSDEVIVIAATNFPEMLDPALVRPGRFDTQVQVGSRGAAWPIRDAHRTHPVHHRDRVLRFPFQTCVVGRKSSPFMRRTCLSLIHRTSERCIGREEHPPCPPLSSTTVGSTW